MAKKPRRSDIEQQRQSRKEVLLARRQKQQTRQIWLAVGGVAGLLLVVLLIGLVNEVIVKPTQPVAVVNGVDITLRDWQTRVRFQRAQMVAGIEDLADTFGQDIGLVQQYAGQQMNLLLDPDTLGQLVLDDMVDETIIRQAAEARGIFVSDADVQKELEESFNYFGGISPTALPTPTETLIPTPSVTPLPTAVITEIVPTNTPFPTPTLGPTSTPRPTATPVTQEAFQEALGETLARFDRLGTDEVTYRSAVRAQLYRQRLQAALAEEQALADEAEQASLFYVAYDSEEEARAARREIEGQDFLSYWNTVRSLPREESSDSISVASELLWRTSESLESLLGPEVSEAAFRLPVGAPSDVLVEAAQADEGTARYYLIQVSGREVRPLSEAELRNQEQQNLTSWLEGQRQSGVQIFERWRANVPQRPVLDARFLVPPTPTPIQATVESAPPSPGS